MQDSDEDWEKCNTIPPYGDLTIIFVIKNVNAMIQLLHYQSSMLHLMFNVYLVLSI